MFGIVDPLGAFRTIGIIQVAETQDEGGILVKDFLPKQYKCIEAYLKALIEIIKKKEVNIHALLLHLKRFDNPSGYNALVGEKYQLTQEEYDLLKEVLL